MVTYKVLGDTLSVLAHELILGITSVVGVHLKQKKSTLVNGHRTMFFFYIFVFYKIQLTATSFDALISSIRAVLVSITLPALRHTHVGARTLESLRTAGLGFCDSIMRKLRDDVTSNISHWVWGKKNTVTLVSVGNMLLTAFLVFIRTIPTVIRAVTHPVAGNAAVVPTFKLGGCTKFICKRSQMELSIWKIRPNHKSCVPCDAGSKRKRVFCF